MDQDQVDVHGLISTLPHLPSHVLCLPWTHVFQVLKVKYFFVVVEVYEFLLIAE